MSRATGRRVARTLSVGLLALAAGGVAVYLFPPPDVPPPRPTPANVPKMSRAELLVRVKGLGVAEVIDALGPPSAEADANGARWMTYARYTYAETPDRSDPMTVVVVVGGRPRRVEFHDGLVNTVVEME